MNAMKILENGCPYCRIIRNTFPVVAIIMLFSLSSCVMPSSVRGKKVYGNASNQNDDENRLDKRKKVDENENPDFSDLLNEAHSIIPPKSKEVKDTLKTANPVNEKAESDITNLILPLNKQIESLTKNQSEIKTSIYSINRDMSNIKADLSEIKEALRQINDKNSFAATGNEELDNISSRKKDKFVLKSDEAAKKENTHETKVKEKQKNVKSSNQKNRIADNKKQEIAPAPEDEKPVTSEVSDVNKLNFELTENYIKNKDYSKAIAKLKDIESSLTTNSEKSNHNYYLGESYFGLQQYQKAIEYYQNVLESSDATKKEDAKVMIAEAQMRNGQTNSAKETFKQLIAEFPKSEHIPRARKMLQKL